MNHRTWIHRLIKRILSAAFALVLVRVLDDCSMLSQNDLVRGLCSVDHGAISIVVILQIWFQSVRVLIPIFADEWSNHLLIRNREKLFDLFLSETEMFLKISKTTDCFRKHRKLARAELLD
jgi:hypothetical protein